MASFNKVILIGNMPADPEQKQTASGISACTFNIAVNRKYKNEDGSYDCDFPRIVAWRKTAEFVTKYFKKGHPILVCGQLQTRSWTDKQGNKQFTTEVVADEVSFVAGKESGTEPKNEAPAGDSEAYTPTGYAGNSNTQFEEIPNDAGLPF